MIEEVTKKRLLERLSLAFLMR